MAKHPATPLRILALALALATATPFSAWAGGVLNFGNSADPETLDPHKTSSVYEANIMRDIYVGLVTVDAKAHEIPGAAEKWTVSPDGLVYTFTLRAGAKWSNGDPLTAEDFVYSFRRMLDPATGAKYANVLYAIKNAEKVNKGALTPADLGVVAKDARTVVITLESPTPYFIGLLTHQTGMPVHRASVEKFGKDFVKPENAVTNGPFVPKESVPNSHVKLVKNPNFYDAASVSLDAVMFYPTEDRSAALRRFQAGELHINNDIPTEQYKFIRDNLKAELHIAPYLGTYYFAFNTKKAPFDDVRVRNALSMAVDREFLADEIWAGTMVPGYSFIPPGTANYGEPAWVSFKDLSPIDREEKAKKLLKEAGYGPEGKKLTLEIRYNTSENHRKTSVALADMWKPYNVEVKLFNTDTKTHYAHLREKGDYDVARAGWIADYNDPQNFLFLNTSDNTGLNYASWSNADYDKAFAAANAEQDLTKRAALMKQAEAILDREEPILSLLYYGSKNLVSTKVVGFEDNILDYHPSRFISLKP